MRHFFILILCLCFSVFSQEKKLEITDINKITYSGNGKLTIQQGTENSLILEGSAEDLQGVSVSMVNHALEIREKRGWFSWVTRPESSLKATVVVENLLEVHTHGQPDVTVDDFETPSLRIMMHDGGKTRFSVNAESLTVVLLGKAQVVGKGEAGKQKVFIKGNGIYDGAELESDTSDVLVTGSGKAIVQADEILNVTIKGSGTVKYLGTPQKIEKHISSRGKLVAQ